MDTAQWPQGIINGVVQKHLETPPRANASALVEKRAPKEQPLNCPRCNSSNTKFCYYNNYSLTQPRYFCKTCRRYWTQGGTLRSVPVGGGSRKNKRPSSTFSSSTTSSSLSKKQLITLPPPLNLINEDGYFRNQNPSFASSELSLSSYVPTVSTDLTNNVNSMFSSLFPFQEFKPTLNYFAVDSHHHDLVGIGNGVHQETTMAKVNGLDQINQVDDRHSIGLLNNDMLNGGVWQL